MKRLALIDDAFLRLESRREPLHIGILMLFEPPAEEGSDFTRRLAERLWQSTTAAAPFNRRLVQRMGLHYWEEDDDFDVGHHFAHTVLPKPGRIRDLLAMVSRAHCGHLDRSYPLWRMYLIEGLADGRIAVYLKIHHALVDGVAGMHMLLKTMSTDPDRSRELPPMWEVQTIKSDDAQPLPVPTPIFGSLPALRSLAREGLNSIGPVLRELRSTFEDFLQKDPDLALAGQAPASVFNSDVSATRRFAAQSYATQRIRNVAAAYSATINDVVLAMCSGALRRYLEELNALPDKPLMAAVPVSIRQSKESAGNEVAFTMTNLATDMGDPAARMRAIKQGMDYNKERISHLSPGQMMAYTALAMLPGTLGTSLGLAKDNALANVVISHVPGPRRPMYWQGAKLCGMYPVSVIIDGGALNITVVSRDDFVDFGLIACRKAVPSVQRLLDYLELALADLEASMAPAPQKRAADRAKKAPATRAGTARKPAANRPKRKSGSRGSRPAPARKQPPAGKRKRTGRSS